MRKIDILNCDIEYIEMFNYDIQALIESNFTLTPKQVQLSSPRQFKISHGPEQSNQIKVYINEFGRSHDGLGKMLMRYPHIHRIFRRPQLI
jgi:hypothetical protein